jgi:hypothetical protein
MIFPQNCHLADNTSGCYPSYSSCSVEESVQTLLVLEGITNIEYQPSAALGSNYSLVSLFTNRLEYPFTFELNLLMSQDGDAACPFL